MSNGDDESVDTPDPADEAASEDESADVIPLADHLEAAQTVLAGDELDEESLTNAIQSLESAIDVAETEADLDAIETQLDTFDSRLEDTDLPEPDDEEDEDPDADLESQLTTLRTQLDEERGPYAEDAIKHLEAAIESVSETRWTTQGEADVVAAADTSREAIATPIDGEFPSPMDIESVPDILEAIIERIDAADLDADDDAETIVELVEATTDLTQALEAAQEWGDLTTREQLEAEGFYEVLGHIKDYPPEWSALKEWEKRGNTEMVLLALEKLGIEFMEEHCLEALKRMGDEAALDPMLERAGRRDRPAIEILGKIGSDEAVDTIIEYVDTDSDPALQKVTMKALGEIGSDEATQPIANKLLSENEIIRSYAARALGMIGDPRAIRPLTQTLEDDDSDSVRGSAAWALTQIGTVDALEVLKLYRTDRSYLVQSEAEKAVEALGTAEPA